MKNKIGILIAAVITLCMLLAACGETSAQEDLASARAELLKASKPADSTSVEVLEGNEDDMFFRDNPAATGFTKPVPDAYFKSADRPGMIEEIRYRSKDYAGDGSEIEKAAYVYLPYGYDEDDTDTRYDVFYFMHGWGGVAGDIFTDSDTKNILDHMIENGDIRPVIFVAATFDAENEPQDFGRSNAEGNVGVRYSYKKLIIA